MPNKDRKINKFLVNRFIISGISIFFIILSLFVLNIRMQYEDIQDEISKNIANAEFVMDEFFQNSKKRLQNSADIFMKFNRDPAILQLEDNSTKLFDGIFYININNSKQNLSFSNNDIKLPENFNINSFRPKFTNNKNFYLSRFIFSQGKYRKFLIYKFDDLNYFVGFLNLDNLNDVFSDIIKGSNTFYLDNDGFFLLSSQPSYVDEHQNIYDVYKDDKDIFNSATIAKSSFDKYDFVYVKRLKNGDFIGASKYIFSISKIYIFSIILIFIVFVVVSAVTLYDIRFLIKRLINPINLLFSMLKNKDQAKELSNTIKIQNKEIGEISDDILEILYNQDEINSKFLDLNIKWDNIFSKSSLIIFIAEVDTGLITRASEGAKNFYGYESFDGYSIFDIEGFSNQAYGRLKATYLKTPYQIMNHITKYNEIKTMQVQKRIIFAKDPFVVYTAYDISHLINLTKEITSQVEFFEYGPNIFLVYDYKNDKVISVSKNEVEIWGYDINQILNKEIDFLSLIQEDDRDKLLNILKSNLKLKDKSKLQFITQLKIKLSDDRFVIFKTDVVLLQNRSLILFYFSNIDDIVTDEKFFKKDVQKYESILNSISFVIWEFDVRSNTFVFNNRIFEILGNRDKKASLKITKDKFQKDFVFMDDLDDFIDTFDSFLSNPKDNFTLEFRIINSEKNVIWIKMIGGVLERKNNKIISLSGMVEDINQIKSHQLQLNLSASVFKYSHEGIVITDEFGKIISVNKAFEELTGYTQAEVVSKDPKFLYDGDYNKFLKQVYKELLKYGFYRGEIYSKRKYQNPYPELLTINVIKDKNGVITNFVGMFFEITAIKEKEKALIKIANYDDLTGLVNKKYFSFLVSNELDSIKENGGNFAILFIDFDGFKEINDTYGHDSGDIFLQKISYEMKSVLRNDDILARLGGDEFGALIKNIGDKFDIILTLNRLLSATTKKISIDDNTQVGISSSIGVCFADKNLSFDELLTRADNAMYKAKMNGKNGYYIYDINNEIKQDKLNSSIIKSMKNDEFFLLYQPIIKGKVIDGFEVYLRWNHPKLGILSPNEFLFDIKNNDIKIKLGKFVFNEAINALKEFDNKFYISINMSLAQICNDEFVKFISDFDKSLLNNIVVELIDINERNLQSFNRFKPDLKPLKFAYSNANVINFDFLINAKFDFIKLDKVMSSNLLTNYDAMQMAISYISFCNDNNIKLIAQGVENRAVFAQFKVLGINNFQGNFIHTSMSKDELKEYLSDFKYDFEISDDLILALHHKDLIDKISILSFQRYEEEFERFCPYLSGEFLQVNLNFYEKVKEIYSVDDDEKLRNFKLNNLKKEIIKYIEIL